MKLEDIGERVLLELARKVCEEGPSVQVGVGDDGAAIELEGGSLVVTTDMLIEDVHFLSDTPPERIGRKAVVINLSDLAAMGAKPLGLVYSLGAPRDTEVEFISRLLEGMNATAREHETYLVGGDMNEAGEIVISGTAFGIVSEDELLLRSGAEVDNLIGITGGLGAATVAVKALLDGKSLEGREPLKGALSEPVARLKEGSILSEMGGVTSAIDITDGLAANLWQISRMSGVGMVVDEDKLPINAAARKFVEEEGLELDNFVLYGGEDFELLFTVRPEAWSRLEKKFEELGTKVTKIGKVDDGGGVRIRRDGKIQSLPDKGYEHFRKSNRETPQASAVE